METSQLQNNTASDTAAYRSYGGGYFETLIAPEQTGGVASMVDMRLPQGSEPPMHIHFDEDEIFYVLEGEVKFTVGGQEIVTKQGQAAFGPRGVAHKFEIMTPEARVLITLTPGHFVNFFNEFSQPVNGQPKITRPQGPPPPEAIDYMAGRLAQEYNCVFVVN